MLVAAPLLIEFELEAALVERVVVGEGILQIDQIVTSRPRLRDEGVADARQKASKAL